MSCYWLKVLIDLGIHLLLGIARDDESDWPGC